MIKQNNSKKYFVPLNTIMKSKKIEQSDFRVHFTLMGVYCANKNHQAVIDDIANRINYLCRVHLLQIACIVEDNIVDISVGLFNDNQAYHFLSQKKKIKLLNQKNQQQQYEPVISRTFQRYNKIIIYSFMRKMQKLKEKEQSSYTEVKAIKSNKQAQNFEENSQNHQHQHQNQQVHENKNSNENKIGQQEPKIFDYHLKNNSAVQNVGGNSDYTSINKTKYLWLFGIPIQFQYDDIQKLFSNRGIILTEGKWLTHDRMEFLEITLKQPIPIPKVFQDLCLKIENYPFITIPKLESKEMILQELQKFILQLTFSNRIEEQSVIHSIDEIGGVNILIRNVHSQEKQIKFLAVFNNILNVERGKNKMMKQYRECTPNKKPIQLKVGRLLKFYTFESLMVQISKNNQKAPLKHY